MFHRGLKHECRGEVLSKFLGTPLMARLGALGLDETDAATRDSSRGLCQVSLARAGAGVLLKQQFSRMNCTATPRFVAESTAHESAGK